MRRARSRLHARGRLHLPAHAARKRRSRPAQARLHRDDALPERRRQLEHLSRRSRQHLALGQVLLLRQAHGHRRRRSRAWPSAASGFWPTAASSRATPSPRCISARSASTTTTPCPPFRRRSFSFPTGSTSISTRSRRGRAPSSFRWPSSTPKSRSRRFPPEQGIDELFVGGRANSILRLRVDRKHLFSWRNFFLVLDRIMHWSEAVHIRPLRKLALQARGKVDARAPRNDRRPRRHLSRHAQRHHRAALPRLLRRRSPGHPRPRRI